MNMLRIVKLGVAGCMIGAFSIGCGESDPQALEGTASSTGATTGAVSAADNGGSMTASQTTSGGSSGAATTMEMTTGVDTESSADNSDTSGESSSGGVSSSGGESSGSTGLGQGLEVIGEWGDLGGFQTITITAATWELQGPITDYVLAIESYDNTERTLLATDEGGTWWRQQWTYDDGGELYHCVVVSGAATMEQAQAAPAADPDDLAGGCDAFPWHDLSPL